ncbi:hypothetical protein BBJ28_00002479 [Nothophytophthora sp. Chile5]|nr:hypothetical protein BBJ28_00002479 [Nothophytophthora sp. Chile5]
MDELSAPEFTMASAPIADDTAAARPASSEPATPLTAMESLARVQKELGVHNSASRAIFAHICQRLSRLETNMREVQGNLSLLRCDTHRDVKDVRVKFSGVHAKVNTMSSQLNEYVSVMDLFQNEMRAQQDNLSWLSTTVSEDQEQIKVVDLVRSKDLLVSSKVDNQRDDFNNRFVELTLKLEELPATLASLQPAPPILAQAEVLPAFTFLPNDNDKLPLQTHMRRLESSKRPGEGPYTDLEPFTIPDDMKVKVEARIRQQASSKRKADAMAAAELADAYRRLQLASVNSNNPRVNELRLSLDQCQQEVKRAFQLIRSSNLQLYSCCESKAERMEIAALQNELKHLRNRLREMENSPTTHRDKQLPIQLGGDVLAANGAVDALMVGSNGATSSKKGSQHLTSGQIPELRVSLLELSRNLNMLKHQWKKQKRNSGGSVNPVALKHLDKLVAMINDAYAVMAEEPVDLAAAAVHVEKVGRVLSSDFSMQILALLGGRSDAPESCRFPVAITARAAAGEMASALCKYSETFTDMFSRLEANSKGTEAALSEWAIEKRTMEHLSREVDTLARNQHALEATLVKLTATIRNNALQDTTGTAEAPQADVVAWGQGEGDQLHSWTTVGDELQALRGQIEAMNKHFVTESTLHETVRHLTREQQRTSSDGGAVVGHRLLSGGAGTPPGTAGALALPSSAALLRRTSSMDNDSSANKMLAALTLDPPEDRLRSQTKLDPLQVVKISGEVRTTKQLASYGGAGAGAATNALNKIHARAQMLRPKSTQRDRDK